MALEIGSYRQLYYRDPSKKSKVLYMVKQPTEHRYAGTIIILEPDWVEAGNRFSTDISQLQLYTVLQLDFHPRAEYLVWE